MLRATPLPRRFRRAAFASALSLLGAAGAPAHVVTNEFVSPCVGIFFVELGVPQCDLNTARTSFEDIVVGHYRMLPPGQVQQGGRLTLTDGSLSAQRITVQRNNEESLLRSTGSDLQAQVLLVNLGGVMEVSGGRVAGNTLWVGGRASFDDAAGLDYATLEVGGQLSLAADPAGGPSALYRAPEISAYGQLAIGAAILSTRQIAVSGGSSLLNGTRLRPADNGRMRFVSSGGTLHFLNAVLEPAQNGASFEARAGGNLVFSGRHSQLEGLGAYPSLDLDVRGGSVLLADDANARFDAEVNGFQAPGTALQPGQLVVQTNATLRGQLSVGPGGEVRVGSGGRLGTADDPLHVRLGSSASALAPKAVLALSNRATLVSSHAYLDGPADVSLREGASWTGPTLEFSAGSFERRLAVDSSSTLNLDRLVMQGTGDIQIEGGPLAQRIASFEAYAAVRLHLEDVQLKNQVLRAHAGAQLSMAQGSLDLSGPLAPSWWADQPGSRLTLDRLALLPGAGTLSVSVTREAQADLFLLGQQVQATEVFVNQGGRLQLGGPPILLTKLTQQDPTSWVSLAALSGAPGLAIDHSGGALWIARSTLGSFDWQASAAASADLESVMAGQAGQGRLRLQDAASLVLRFSTVAMGELALSGSPALSIQEGSVLTAASFDAQGTPQVALGGVLAVPSLRWQGGTLQTGRNAELNLIGRRPIEVLAGRVELDGQIHITQSNDLRPPLPPLNGAGTLVLNADLRVINPGSPMTQWALSPGQSVPLMTAGQIDLGGKAYQRTTLQGDRWVTEMDGGLWTLSFDRDRYAPSNAAISPWFVQHDCSRSGAVLARCEGGSVLMAGMLWEPTFGSPWQRTPLPGDMPANRHWGDALARYLPDPAELARANRLARDGTLTSNANLVGTLVGQMSLDGLSAYALSRSGQIDVVVVVDENWLAGADTAAKWNLDGRSSNAQLGAYLNNLSSFVGSVGALHRNRQMAITGAGLGGVLAAIVGHRAGVDTYTFDAAPGSVARSGLYEASLSLAASLRGRPNLAQVVNFVVAGSPAAQQGALPFGQTVTLTGDPMRLMVSRRLTEQVFGGAGFDDAILQGRPAQASAQASIEQGSNAAWALAHEAAQFNGYVTDAFSDDELVARLRAALGPHLMGLSGGGTQFTGVVEAQAPVFVTMPRFQDYILRPQSGPLPIELILPSLDGAPSHYHVALLRGGAWQSLGDVLSGQWVSLGGAAWEALRIDTEGTSATAAGSFADAAAAAGTPGMALLMRFGQSGSVRIGFEGVAAVPEPGSAWLLLAGGLVLATRRSWRRQD